MLGRMVDMFCSRGFKLSGFFFFSFFKLSQNKTELQTEHTAKKRKNQEQKKTEGRREWDAGEEEAPHRGKEAQATD